MNNNKIPFLMYHNINKEGDIYSVSKNNFIDQMNFLFKNNFQTLSLDVFTPWKRRLLDVTKNFVVITFDDGFKDNYAVAFPVLQKYGFIANFFITTDYIDQRNDFITTKQIRDLYNNGMVIGSHTKSHLFLNKLRESDLILELNESKKILEKITCSTINHLSLPGGRYNKNVIHTAKKIGYKTICNSDIKFNNKESDTYRLGRIPIRKNTSLTKFAGIMNHNFRVLNKLRFARLIKKSLCFMLGDEFYDKIWHLKHN